MPTVLDTPDICDESVVTPLSAAPPHTQRVPTGRWQRLTQAVGRRHAGSTSRVSIETYPERLAREQPYLYIYAYALCGN